TSRHTSSHDAEQVTSSSLRHGSDVRSHGQTSRPTSSHDAEQVTSSSLRHGSDVRSHGQTSRHTSSHDAEQVTSSSLRHGSDVSSHGQTSRPTSSHDAEQVTSSSLRHGSDVRSLVQTSRQTSSREGEPFASSSFQLASDARMSLIDQAHQLPYHEARSWDSRNQTHDDGHHPETVSVSVETTIEGATEEIGHSMHDPAETRGPMSPIIPVIPALIRNPLSMTTEVNPPTRERITAPDPAGDDREQDSRITLREVQRPAELKDGLLRDYISSITNEEDIELVGKWLNEEAKRRHMARITINRDRRADTATTEETIPRRITSLD
ncbi:hypothetical protein ADUPG1_002358, partial [Aduncisulcus paluster]